MSYQRLASLLAICGCLLRAPVALADDPCAAFSWNVGQERALFAGEAESVRAGRDLKGAAIIQVARLYDLELVPQPDVAFVAAPGKKMLADGAFAGLSVFTVASAGVYRVSLDQPFWLDVAANGQLIRSKDFQGRPGCNAPHKVVEFELPAATPLVLQLSGGTATHVKVTLTRSPVQSP